MALRIDAPPVPSTANVLTGELEPALEHPIELYDNTLREGEQPPGVVFRPQEKLEIAQLLDDMGVHWANVGFPAVSREEQEAVKRICAARRKMKIAVLSRLVPRDIEISVECGVDLVSLFFGGSDIHLAHKYGVSEDEALPKIEQAIRRVRDLGSRAAFTIEDGSRTPLPRIRRMFQVAQDAGADYLVLADTVGVLTPASTAKVIGVLAGEFARPIGLHFHDDLGLALANTLAGLGAGAQLAHVTVNGVGERCGNTCLEELALVLPLKMGRDVGVDTSRLAELSALVHRASGTAPPPHKSVTGRWAFTHEAGIHVAGMLAHPETYQPYPPSMVGRHHEIVFGKHSGTQSVTYLARQQGVTLAEDQARAVLERIKAESESGKSSVSEERIASWIREAAGR